MSKIIDTPWAIVYGPHGRPGLMYGLGLSRKDAWQNALLVYRGYDAGPLQMERDKKQLQKQGMVARKVTVSI